MLLALLHVPFPDGFGRTFRLRNVVYAFIGRCAAIQRASRYLACLHAVSVVIGRMPGTTQTAHTRAMHAVTCALPARLHAQ